MPEIIEPVFAKTSPKRGFSMSENERFGLVFAKTGSINSGTVECTQCCMYEHTSHYSTQHACKRRAYNTEQLQKSYWEGRSKDDRLTLSQPLGSLHWLYSSHYLSTSCIIHCVWSAVGNKPCKYHTCSLTARTWIILEGMDAENVPFQLKSRLSGRKAVSDVLKNFGR